MFHQHTWELCNQIKYEFTLSWIWNIMFVNVNDNAFVIWNTKASKSMLVGVVPQGATTIFTYIFIYNENENTCICFYSGIYIIYRYRYTWIFMLTNFQMMFQLFCFLFLSLVNCVVIMGQIRSSWLEWNGMQWPKYIFDATFTWSFNLYNFGSKVTKNHSTIGSSQHSNK